MFNKLVIIHNGLVRTQSPTIEHSSIYYRDVPYVYIPLQDILNVLPHYFAVSHSNVWEHNWNSFCSHYQFALAIFRKALCVDINQISVRIKYRYLKHINQLSNDHKLMNKLKHHRHAQTWPFVSVSHDWSRDHINRIRVKGLNAITTTRRNWTMSKWS